MNLPAAGWRGRRGPRAIELRAPSRVRYLQALKALGAAWAEPSAYQDPATVVLGERGSRWTLEERNLGGMLFFDGFERVDGAELDRLWQSPIRLPNFGLPPFQ